MNDKDILLRLLQRAYTDDTLTQAAKKEYETLVARFDEEGTDLEIPDGDLDVGRAAAFHELSEAGYIDHLLRFHGMNEGHVLHVTLRAGQFLEMMIRLEDEQETAGSQEDDPPERKPMQDSGKREIFSTGAVRDSAEGKPRPDLFSPFAMQRIGLWLTRGAEKYSEHNWLKGIPASRCLASLHRHLMKYMQGATDEDHLSAVATNCMFLLHFDEAVKRGFLPESLLDLPKYEPMPGVHRNQDEPLEYEPDEELFLRNDRHEAENR